MPLSPHEQRMKDRMAAEYGDKKGESVFYASVNAGKPGFTDQNAVKRRLKRGLARV